MASQRARSSRTATDPVLPDDQVAIDVPGSADIEGPPRVTYELAVRDFAIDVLSAASFREASARGATSEEVQYTSAYFEAAKFEVRNAGYVRKTPKWHPFAKVVSPVSFVVAGVAIPSALAKDPWPGWGFVAGGTFVIGVLLAVAVEFKKGGD